MTAHRRKVEAADKALDNIVNKVLAEVSTTDVKLSDCLLLASPELRAAYEAAGDRVTKEKASAVSAGKAWRGRSGMLCWYVS